jgi:hypothetical protein
VLSSLQNAVRQRSSRPLPWPFFAPLFLFLVAIPGGAQSSEIDAAPLDDAVRQLAERVAAIPNLHGSIRLQFVQDANFAVDTGKDWQEVFRKEIESRRVSVTEDPGATLLRVGLAETPTQLVLSAGVRVAEKEEVRLVTIPRSSFRAANLPVAPVRIEKQLVYQGPDRVLDAASFRNGNETGIVLLALRNAEFTLMHLDRAGEVKQAFSLAFAGIQVSRGPRGELSVGTDGASVLLPGKACQFVWSSPSEGKCRVAKSAWRGPTVLTPSCDVGGWKLLADAGDWTTPDLLQVVPEGTLQKHSAVLLSDFPGPILNIHGEQDPATALVVTRNLRTGNYEVYKVTLACGN